MRWHRRDGRRDEKGVRYIQKGRGKKKERKNIINVRKSRGQIQKQEKKRNKDRERL